LLHLLHLVVLTSATLVVAVLVAATVKVVAEAVAVLVAVVPAEAVAVSLAEVVQAAVTVRVTDAALRPVAADAHATNRFTLRSLRLFAWGISL
jgi:hypothetical protein